MSERSYDVAKKFLQAAQRSDSWGEVEDQGADCKSGRYGVMIFFDTKEEAEAFHRAAGAAINF